MEKELRQRFSSANDAESGGGMSLKAPMDDASITKAESRHKTFRRFLYVMCGVYVLNLLVFTIFRFTEFNGVQIKVKSKTTLDALHVAQPANGTNAVLSPTAHVDLQFIYPALFIFGAIHSGLFSVYGPAWEWFFANLVNKNLNAPRWIFYAILFPLLCLVNLTLGGVNDAYVAILIFVSASVGILQCHFQEERIVLYPNRPFQIMERLEYYASTITGLFVNLGVLVVLVYVLIQQKTNGMLKAMASLHIVWFVCIMVAYIARLGKDKINAEYFMHGATLAITSVSFYLFLGNKGL
jgi:hypothetical protein